MSNKRKAIAVLVIGVIMFAAIALIVFFLAELPAPLLKVRSEDQRITVSWNIIKKADGYSVYRKSDNNWIRIGRLSGNCTTRYTDKKVNAAEEYEYMVQGYSSFRKCKKSKSVSCVCRLKTPEIRLISRRKMKWNAVPGAEKYIILIKKADKWINMRKTNRTYCCGKFQHNNCYSVMAEKGRCRSRFDETYSDRYFRGKKYRSKKVIAEGDSITAPTYSWAYRTANLYGMSIKNMAVDSSTVTMNYKNPGLSLFYRAKTQGYEGDCEMLWFFAGTNDYDHDLEIGKLNDTGGSTYYGAWNYIISKAKHKAPGAKIVIITPLERGRYHDNYYKYGYITKNKAGYALLDYCNASKNIAKKYGCYLYDSKKANIVNGKTIYEYMPDKLHPSSLLHIKISDDFAEYLKQNVL